MSADHSPTSSRQGVTAEAINEALSARLQPVELSVEDDSHLHAGHAGARDGRHFSVRMVGACFEGKSRVARHRLIYDALSDLFPLGIHALAIDAKAPSETAAT
jgi:BolA family transcriptional regulator, general stress-responsive regulator